jgi:transcriptional regulator with XRE-family HTH domain
MASVICGHCGHDRAEGRCECIPVAFWQRADVREAVARSDVTRIVRLLRTHTELTQEAIGNMTGLSQGMVSQMESGKRSLRSPIKKRRALEGLGTPQPVLEYVTHFSGPEVCSETTEVHDLIAYAAQVTMGVVPQTPDRWTSPFTIEAAQVPQRVTMANVEHLEAVTHSLRAADYRYGGGACRDAINAHTAHARRFLTAASENDRVKARLHLALADLHNLAGWTEFDIGGHSTARWHFARALEHAHHAQEPSLSANVLYRMGRLHLHRGLISDALRFFQLGQIAGQNSGCGVTVAILHANEAWAYALTGDPSRALQALGRSQDEFTRVPSWARFFGTADLDAMTGDPSRALQALGRSQDEFTRTDHTRVPSWARFFGTADLDAMTGVVNASLVELVPRAYNQATTSLTRSLSQRGPEMSRSRAFELAALATAHITGGDTAEGVEAGYAAVDLAERLCSARVIDRLAPLAAAAQAVHTIDAADLVERIATLRTR